MKLTLALVLIAVGHLGLARAADLERPKIVNNDRLKHSGESVFGTRPGDCPAKCSVPSTCKAGLLYLHPLPEFQEEIVVKEVSRPKQVRLLRTGAKLSYSLENGTLRVQVPTPLRTDAVDTVAVTLSRR